MPCHSVDNIYCSYALIQYGKPYFLEKKTKFPFFGVLGIELRASSFGAGALPLSHTPNPLEVCLSSRVAHFCERQPDYNPPTSVCLLNSWKYKSVPIYLAYFWDPYLKTCDSGWPQTSILLLPTPEQLVLTACLAPVFWYYNIFPEQVSILTSDVSLLLLI